MGFKEDQIAKLRAENSNGLAKSSKTNTNFQGLQDIKIKQKIGGTFSIEINTIIEGNFGTVYQGTWLGTTEVALKQLKLEVIEQFQHELGIMRYSPNLLFTSFQQP
jgi:hypothetical protein